ncbi:5-hydroxytryptamine receptor 3A [Triplophysa tibetana]|uniref:5-hydroxytryptamine receptor 3A n=1 Tax=Triplophysa tibetana TaxID=1572043 RepID=A0A5A9PMK0_9TELE|nr:5-hydroxytryptamine receptor 3A [Triplophysa tibetana]
MPTQSFFSGGINNVTIYNLVLQQHELTDNTPREAGLKTEQPMIIRSPSKPVSCLRGRGEESAASSADTEQPENGGATAKISWLKPFAEDEDDIDFKTVSMITGSMRNFIEERWVSADISCNSTHYARAYVALFKDLDQSNNNSVTKKMMPINEYYGYTWVSVYLYVTAITDVNENAQSITTQVQVDTWWRNNDIYWRPSNYCDIDRITMMKELFWAPDIVVLESIKTEFAAKESPYVKVHSWGSIQKMEIVSLTTACSMDLYKFPFDTQQCLLTFKSLMHSDQELKLYGSSTDFPTSDSNKQSLTIPGEWQLVEIKSSYHGGEKLTFQMTIKRKPLVYVINLIFPVFCFLVLDVASFFIKASQADKLTFKVTLLLSISVLLQVLNDRLTATTSDIPLIGVYCGVIFALIGISILETILVNVLKAKGRRAKSVTPENTRAAVTGPDDHVNDLNNSLETSGNEEPTCMLDIGKKSSLWAKAAKITDVSFIVLYIVTIIVFLSVIASEWLK